MCRCIEQLLWHGKVAHATYIYNIYIYIICLFSLLAHRSNIGVLDLRVANRAGKAVSVCVSVALHKAVGNLFVTEMFGSSSLENKNIYIYNYLLGLRASAQHQHRF